MSAVISAFTGTGGGGNQASAGANYKAGQADLLNPYAGQQDAQSQYAQAQNEAQQGITNQAGFLNAVQAQNGLGNQSSVYNQLQGVANGTGPNPAQAQLAQATGANTANQAALMAGQRGTSANAGLLARQAAMQGGANQQNAAGQAATLQANQSLNALNNMGSLATNQANQQANATSAYTNAAQAEQGQQLTGINNQNSAANTAMGSQNTANAGVAGTVAKGQGDLLGGVLQGASMAFANGGSVQNYDLGGGVTNLNMSQGATTGQGPQSSLGKAVAGGGAGMSDPNSQLTQGGKALGKGIGNALSGMFGSSDAPPTMAGGADASDLSGMGTMMAAEGGPVSAMVSPGERYLSPKAVSEVQKGKDPMKAGEKIPGKPKVSGDKNSYANDIVPKTLEEGGIVLPRSVTQSKHPHWAAHAFVSAIMAKQGKSMPKKGDKCVLN